MIELEDNYNRFVLFLSNRRPNPDSDYLTQMRVKGKIMKRKKMRSLYEIICELGQGYQVIEWKKKLKQSRLIDQINSLCDGDFDSVDEDLTVVDYMLLGTFIPRFPKKETISSWRVASQKGCLLSYFDKADIFGICSGKTDEYLFDYSGDYYDYVRTFPLADRVRFYRTYLTLNSVEIPIKNNSFDDPRYFFSVSERQSAEYERILMSVERSPDDVFYFLGDGVGVGSMISIKNGWNFFSSEIGRVGSMAIRLGIINVIEYKLVEVPKNAILVLLNVEEYLMDDEVEMYSHFFPRVLVVSENRDSRLGAEFISSDSKIFSRGIVFHHVPVIKPISMTADYLRAREPVMPIDIKSFI